MNPSPARRKIWRALAGACAVASVSMTSLVYAACPDRLVRVINAYLRGGVGDMIACELANGMQVVMGANAISDDRLGIPQTARGVPNVQPDWQLPVARQVGRGDYSCAD